MGPGRGSAATSPAIEARASTTTARLRRTLLSIRMVGSSLVGTAEKIDREHLALARGACSRSKGRTLPSDDAVVELSRRDERWRPAAFVVNLSLDRVPLSRERRVMTSTSGTSTTGPSTETRARWRVALLGVYDGAAEPLTAAVTHAGGQVVIAVPARVDSLTLLEPAAPDVLILQPSRASGRHPDLLPFTSAACPLVLYTHDTSRAMLKLAARSGVTALIVDPLSPAQLAPTLDLAVARFRDCEVLRRKLADRKVIERAKGRLMALAHITEDEAFRWLRTRAMNGRSRLADVARGVLERGTDGGGRATSSDPPRTLRRVDPRDTVQWATRRTVDNPGPAGVRPRPSARRVGAPVRDTAAMLDR